MAEQNASINGSSGVDYYTNASINRSSGDYEDEWRRQLNEFAMKYQFAGLIFIKIFLAIEILVMILTLFGLCGLIKSNRSTPVFVINLILSDLIQIICTLMIFTGQGGEVYFYCLIVGLYFMACVAFERYLLVSHPIWYKSHHSLKVCCLVSVIIWLVPLILTVIDFSELTIPIIFLIPYLIIILCFVGTCRGLSRVISLTPLKRKKILGSLFLVLLTYTFLILPFLITMVTLNLGVHKSVAFVMFSCVLLFLNPLADCVLYIFLRPDVGGFMKSVLCCCRTGVGGLMKSVLCCCRTDTHQSSTHSRDEHSRDSRAVFACVSMQKPASHSQTACSSV